MYKSLLVFLKSLLKKHRTCCSCGCKSNVFYAYYFNKVDYYCDKCFKRDFPNNYKNQTKL